MIENWIQWAQTSPFTPPLILGIYLAGAFSFFPTVLLFILSIHVFGALTGSLYAFAGISCSGALSFLIGRYFGLDFIQKIPLPGFNGEKVESFKSALQSTMQDKGIWWVAALRNAPVAPFVVVNVGLGATQMRIIDFLLGNALGVTPTILAIVYFEEKVLAAVENNDLSIAIPALLILGLLYLLSVAARRLLAK